MYRTKVVTSRNCYRDICFYVFLLLFSSLSFTLLFLFSSLCISFFFLCSYPCRLVCHHKTSRPKAPTTQSIFKILIIWLRLSLFLPLGYGVIVPLNSDRLHKTPSAEQPPILNYHFKPKRFQIASTKPYLRKFFNNYQLSLDKSTKKRAKE